MLTLMLAASLAIAMAGSQAPSVPVSWQTYRNAAVGYELRYPPGYEVRATGLEPERDGSRIRVAIREYEALSPVLDVFVKHGLTGTDLPPGIATWWRVAPSDVELPGGRRCVMTVYRDRAAGQIMLVDVRCADVLFRLTPSPGTDDIRTSVWWQIVSSFRFGPGTGPQHR